MSKQEFIDNLKYGDFINELKEAKKENITVNYELEEVKRRLRSADKRLEEAMGKFDDYISYLATQELPERTILGKLKQ